MCKKQQLLHLYNAFYQCQNNTAKLQFLYANKTLIQSFNINFVNVLALFASFVETFLTALQLTKEGK